VGQVSAPAGQVSALAVQVRHFFYCRHRGAYEGMVLCYTYNSFIVDDVYYEGIIKQNFPKNQKNLTNFSTFPRAIWWNFGGFWDTSLAQLAGP
jgi:hypothetical protein